MLVYTHACASTATSDAIAIAGVQKLRVKRLPQAPTAIAFMRNTAHTHTHTATATYAAHAAQFESNQQRMCVWCECVCSRALFQAYSALKSAWAACARSRRCRRECCGECDCALAFRVTLCYVSSSRGSWASERAIKCEPLRITIARLQARTHARTDCTGFYAARETRGRMCGIQFIAHSGHYAFSFELLSHCPTATNRKVRTTRRRTRTATQTRLSSNDAPRERRNVVVWWWCD